MAMLEKEELLTLTAEIAAAYLSNNTVPPSELPDLLANVHQALATVGAEQEDPNLVPAVPVRKSVSGSHIICLEDGVKQKMIKRHLRSAHDMSPEEYREKWQLPSDYPMVAPDYAALRSRMAKKIGLGKQARGKRGNRGRTA